MSPNTNGVMKRITPSVAVIQSCQRVFPDISINLQIFFDDLRDGAPAQRICCRWDGRSTRYVTSVRYSTESTELIHRPTDGGRQNKARNSSSVNCSGISSPPYVKSRHGRAWPVR